MPISRHRSRGSYFKQHVCKERPPCSRGKVEYKMRKSRKRCSRSPYHKRIGPSRINSTLWLKFLRSHGGKGYTRKELQKMYHHKFH